MIFLFYFLYSTILEYDIIFIIKKVIIIRNTKRRYLCKAHIEIKYKH